MKHVITHNLDLAQSRRMAERAIAKYEKRFAKYEPNIRWIDDRRASVDFKAKGFSVHGTVELRPGAVEIDLEVPFLFRVFRAPAIRILDAELKKLLAEEGPSRAPQGEAASSGV